jgi:hypothetical protein
MDARNVGFSLPKKTVTVYGPRVREPQKTIEIPSRATATAAPPAVVKPLQIVSAQPSYLPPPPSPPAEGASRLWVTWGSVNNAVATNWDAYFDLSADAVIYAEITLNTTSTYELISSWEIATGTSVPAQMAWPESSPGGSLRPAKLYILLGTYIHAASAVSNTGGGSLIVGEYVTGMYDDYTSLGAVLTKALTWSRINS